MEFELLIKTIKKMDEKLLDSFAQNLLKHKPNTIWIIGNGGSASTASHFTSDLNSLGFNARCLCDNVPRLTALTNDYGWDEVYIKQLSHLKPNDVLILISVHGGSDSWSNNLIKALFYAKGRGAKILSLTGFDGGITAKNSNHSIIVPAERTYIIEGIHCVLTHIIWQKIKDLEQK